MNVEAIFNKYFNGQKNFITPTTYGFGSKGFGDKILLYEKSKGNGLYDEPIYAITFLLLKGTKVQRIDLSKPFDNANQVNYYLKTITNEMVENADLYGEVKDISLYL